MPKKTHPVKTVDIFLPYYTVSTVNPKESRTVRHHGHPSVITIEAFLCYFIGTNVATRSVTELYFKEILMSGLPSSLSE